LISITGVSSTLTFLALLANEKTINTEMFLGLETALLAVNVFQRMVI